MTSAETIETILQSQRYSHLIQRSKNALKVSEQIARFQQSDRIEAVHLLAALSTSKKVSLSVKWR
jgi:hypothetical protein